ncbi:MAG: DUF882 domain-containing protein [Deltaproteobacteria bacterium]|nr:DUF882 domain-containing protein [Deltaproteobacteria bacterium]
MKPVVSSIVALAIAIAPFAAWAEKPHHGKPVPAKVMKTKVEKADKEAKVEKADKADKKVTKVVAKKKEALKPVVHHAHGADLSGAGHKEPSVSPTAKAHGKITRVSHTTTTPTKELPKLPAASMKPAKAGHDKGKKGAEKKTESSGDDNSGQTERDGEFADLVARIRAGKHPETKPEAKEPKDSKKSKLCEKDPIEIIRGPEIDTFSLMKCDGTVAPLAAERLSIAIRPGSSARPTTPIAELAKKKSDELSPGVHRVDERLVKRIQAVADHFGKHGPVKLSIVSGYRPSSVGSMHAVGRAIDFRLEGAKNEDVVAFCKTLDDTGCGYYPNSSFVHIDVRDPGAGHVSWIDASGPGEAPKYVPSWPPPVSSRGKSDDLAPVAAREPIPQVDRDGQVEILDPLP